jgi:tol-pal system protein YbgF
MNWKTNLAAMVAIGVALLAGCGGARPEPSASPRMQAEDATAALEVRTLRQENEALKKEQLNASRQLEALTKQLAAEKDEQRRFREMMATNFDLLEQSVALTLAKSIERGTATDGAASRPAGADKTSAVSGQAAAPAKAPEGAPPRSKPAEDAGGPTGHVPSFRSVPPVASQAQRPALGADRSSGAAATAKTAAPRLGNTPLPAPVVADEPKRFEDADLTPPKNPKKLAANPAAKPLYDKGFGFYANKQYDQAVLVFENFLSRYPQDIYSDNAQFWIAEANLQTDKLADAESAYRKVLREYEHKSTLDGFKTPDAIYRLGTIAQKRSQPKLAQYYFHNVAQRFPDTSAGRKAQKEVEGASPATARRDAEQRAASGG